MLFEVSGLRKTFGTTVAVDDAGFAVEIPGIVGLIGPNGAGKTTLFDIICGRQQADAGTVRFEGRRVDGLHPHQLSRLGFARSFQECRVLPEETCLDNLLFAAQEKRLWHELLGILVPPRRQREQARALLALTGLSRYENTPAADLSFGQRRLIEIASALITEPRVLLLDEPASGVNPTLLGTLHDVLAEAVPRTGALLLLIEHNMEFVMSLADRIVVMHQGKVLADDTPAAVQADARVIDAYLG